MKSIILGAFILSIFFAVAQSINVSQHHSRFQYKNKSGTGTTAADSIGASEYVHKTETKNTQPTAPSRNTTVAVKTP